MITGSIWHPDLEALFLQHTGRNIDGCDLLSSHGSDRVIIRLKSHHGPSAVGIINKHIEENRTFISFSKHFKTFDLHVPEIYGESNDLQCYLMEDLGDKTLYDLLRQENPSRVYSDDILKLYSEVISELPKFQIEAGKTIDYSLCYQHPVFDENNIRHDLNYFREMFLENFYPNYDETMLDKDLSLLLDVLIHTDNNYFLYRDFQSRNIMIKNNKPYFIDYQSGRKGALQYDIASLLFDAKANLSWELREWLLNKYADKVSEYIQIDQEEFFRIFWFYAVIRILQAMGAYGYLGLVKKKTRFLESIPYAVNNISYILDNKIKPDNFPYLKDLFLKVKDV